LTERIEAGKLKVPELKTVSLKSKPNTIKGQRAPAIVAETADVRKKDIGKFV